ncbi:MAG: hypothetical protein WCS05_04450, partial [Bacteroidales bacterium]
MFDSLKVTKFNLFFAIVVCEAMCFAALPVAAQNVSVVSRQPQQVQSYKGTYYFTLQATKAVDVQSSDYYRVVEANNNFKDYYTKGDLLRAKGTVAYLDA